MRLPDRQVPNVVAGIGCLLVLVLAAEAVWRAAAGGLLDAGWLFGIAVGLPFLVGLLYGGYWLAASDVPVERYRRVLAWTAGGLLVFAAILTPMFVLSGPIESPSIVAQLRWTATVGAGAGLLLGLFEARAFTRAAEAERVRVLAEEARSREELLEYLNSLLRHEILNTANVIDGHAERIERAVEEPGERTERSVAVIRRRTDKLGRTIEDVRVLLEVTHGEIDFEPVDVTAAIDAEAAAVAERVERVELSTELPERAMVPGDQLLHRVFASLLDNAVEHNDSEAPVVEVVVERRAEDVVVTIDDNGSGIPPSERETLFDVHTRSDADHGIGTALVAKLVERYDGAVELAETGPDGTTVELEFPRATATRQ